MTKGYRTYRTYNDFNIILINDASSDGYDYQSIAKQFNAIYIEHSERKGVAFSRDEGIDICTTNYFLLLDAHMRIFKTIRLVVISYQITIFDISQTVSPLSYL